MSKSIAKTAGKKWNVYVYNQINDMYTDILKTLKKNNNALIRIHNYQFAGFEIPSSSDSLETKVLRTRVATDVRKGLKEKLEKHGLSFRLVKPTIYDVVSVDEGGVLDLVGHAKNARRVFDRGQKRAEDLSENPTVDNPQMFHVISRRFSKIKRAALEDSESDLLIEELEHAQTEYCTETPKLEDLN